MQTSERISARSDRDSRLLLEKGEESDYWGGVAAFYAYERAYSLLTSREEASLDERILCSEVYGSLLLHPEESRAHLAGLIDGIKELYDGTAELKDCTAEMREETDGMEDEISDRIDEMLESITGGSAEVVSFVSEKNTSVEAVQFVIQTEAVEIDEAETVAPVVKEELTFWQKILRLFGLI